MKWKKLIIIGDSNAQQGYSIDDGCWVSLLSDFLQRKCDVINRGFSGYNTSNIREFLPDILEEFDAESICGVVIMLGTNDSAISSSPQHVSIEKYIENLQWIISYFNDKFGITKEKIIIICPGRVDDDKWAEVAAKINENHSLFDNLVEKYAEECEIYANQNNITNINLYKIMSQQNENYKEFFYDGIHLSKKGGQLLFKHLKPIVQSQILADISKSNYPDWKELNI